MNRRSVVTAMVVGASLLVGESMYASPVYKSTTGHSMFVKEKTVKFNLRNESAVPMTVKANGVEMTLEPGKTVPMKLVAGVQIVSVGSYSHYEAGSVIATVSDVLQDATLTLK